MYDLTGYIILFCVGLITGVINVTAGGGSSITLPVLIFLGMDPALANGTLRLSIISQNISASLAFYRENFPVNRESIILAVLTVPGAVLGAFFAVTISDVWFERILAFIMILIVVTALFPSRFGVKSVLGSRYRWLVYPSFVLIGLYGGFIQVGIGLMIIAVLSNLAGFDLITTNMHKVFVQIIYTLPALVVFIISDNVEWVAAIMLAAGTVFGGWWAARMSVRKGERFIRYFLVAAVFIMALKLIGVF